MTAGSRAGVYLTGSLLTLIMLATLTAAGVTPRVVLAGATSEDDVDISRSSEPTRPSWPPEEATIPDPTGTGGHVTARLVAVYQALRAQGMVHSAYCWDEHLWNPTSDHPKGRACDLFYNHRAPADVAFGWQVANWLTTNEAVYAVRTVIWQGQIWNARRATWRPYQSRVYNCPDPENITGCHYDHIHVSVY
jgi:hypothetical protein